MLQRARALGINTKFLFVSGEPPDDPPLSGIDERARLRKPWKSAELLARVRAILDSDNEP